MKFTCPCGETRYIRPSDVRRGMGKYCSVRCRANFKPSTVEERFWQFVFPEPNSGCWLWTGALHDGYGQFCIRTGLVRRAHRVCWELMRGPIPDGLQIDHLCRTPSCVNPDHLEPVTPRVNTLRSTSLSALNARKTHCLRGHPLDDANTRVYRGQRNCRACRAFYRAKYRKPSAALFDAAMAAGRDRWY
jgi:hypothetical protein